MGRDGHPPRGRRGVWRQGRLEGQGGSRAERFARGPCRGSASRVAGGGDRRGDRRRRRRGLEDFGKERPKVQHSDLHIPVLEILSQTLTEPQDHGKPGLGAPSTAARRNRDEEAWGGAGRRSWGPRTPRSPGGLWCSPHAEARPRALSPAALGTALPDALTTCRSLRLLAAQGAAATLCGKQSLLCPGAVRPPRTKGPGAHGGNVLQPPAPAPPRAEGGYLGLRPLEIPRRAPGTAQAVAKLNKNPA